MRTLALFFVFAIFPCTVASAQFIALEGQGAGSDGIRIGDLNGEFLEPFNRPVGSPVDTNRLTFTAYSRARAGINQDEIIASDLLAGSTQVLVTGVPFEMHEFAVDEAGGMVFSNRYTGSGDAKDIVQHDLATGAYQVLHVTGRVDAICVDSQSQNVYWLQPNSSWSEFALWRCAYDGTSLTQLNLFTPIRGSMADLKYIRETGDLLISDAGQGSPALLDLDGSVVLQTSITADPNRYMSAVHYDPHQGLLYWVEQAASSSPLVYRQSFSGSGSSELLAVLNHNPPGRNRLIVFPDFDGDELGTYREALWGTADDDLDSDDDGLADADEYTESRSQVWFPAPSGAETHYYALSAATDYHTAAEEARRFGGYLASVGDAAENDAIGDGIRWAPNYHRGPALMGLHRPTGAAPWAWDSGEPLSFRNASSPQPQDRYAHWDTNLSTNHTWFFTDSPTGQAVIESPWEPVLSPANADSDGDGLQDGMERGLTTGIAGQPAQGILGTDLQVFQPDSDPQTTTSPLDADADEDGLLDGIEDANGNGAVDAGELDPLLQDTDGDLIQDGTERGLTTRHAHTHPGDFQPDRDPLTTTDPLDPDTDGGGLRDGLEDLDGDGALVFWEFDPLSAADDRFDLLSPGLVSGQSATLTLSGHRAGSKLLVLASFTGAGEIQVFPNLYLDLLPPHHATPTVLSYSTTTTIPVSVPAAVPPGTSIWLQAVEEVADLGAYRTSDLVGEVVQ